MSENAHFFLTLLFWVQLFWVITRMCVLALEKYPRRLTFRREWDVFALGLGMGWLFWIAWLLWGNAS